jgi:DNA polymerase
LEKNILDKIDDYFAYQKESFGNDILLELDKIDNTEIIPAPKQIVKATEKVQVFESVIKKDIPVVNNSDLSIESDWFESQTMPELNSKICKCMECQLGSTRTNFVFGSGNPNANIMIIGEAPGADEDEQGLPFVGRAGQLLTKILESINLSREEVYIANIVKCRPPQNRRPEKNEVDKCEPYLKKQIELINPEFILSLGLTSVDTLLKKTHKMAESRGQILDYEGRKMLVTYHPAALLRNPNWKKFVWEDVKLLRKLYDEFIEKKK